MAGSTKKNAKNKKKASSSSTPAAVAADSSKSQTGNSKNSMTKQKQEDAEEVKTSQPSPGVSYKNIVEIKPEVKPDDSGSLDTPQAGMPEAARSKPEGSSIVAPSQPTEGLSYKNAATAEPAVEGASNSGRSEEKQPEEEAALPATPEDIRPRQQGPSEAPSLPVKSDTSSSDVASSTVASGQLGVDAGGSRDAAVSDTSSGQLPAGTGVPAAISSFKEPAGDGDGSHSAAASDAAGSLEAPQQEGLPAEGAPGEETAKGAGDVVVAAPQSPLPGGTTAAQDGGAAPGTLEPGNGEAAAGGAVEDMARAQPVVGSSPVPAAALAPDMSGSGLLSPEEGKAIAAPPAGSAAATDEMPPPPAAEAPLPPADQESAASASAAAAVAGPEEGMPLVAEEEEGGWVLVPEAPYPANAPAGAAVLADEISTKPDAMAAAPSLSWPWLLVVLVASPGLLLLASPFLVFWFFLAGVSTVVGGLYQLVKPPPFTAPRVRLSDGLHLAYEEGGVPEERARHTILYHHGTPGCRIGGVPGASPALLEEFGVRVVSYDRPGMGQSDYRPDATSLRASARQMAELADALRLGPRFWVLGYSGGGPHAWAAARYIPDRLAGLAQWGPEGSPWWASLEARPAARAAVWAGMPRVARDRYISTRLLVKVMPPWLAGVLVPPALVRWLMLPLARKWLILPSLSYVGERDWRKLNEVGPFLEAQVREALRQGNVRAIYEDLAAPAQPWSFDITDLASFPRPIHIWQGTDDRDVPPSLNRYAADVLPNAALHVLEGHGHYSSFVDNDAFHREFLTTLFGPPLGPLPSAKEQNVATPAKGQEKASKSPSVLAGMR